MSITQESVVGQLVTEKPARSQIFEKYGVDYCCGGRKSLKAACEEKNLPVENLINELLKNDDATEIAQEPDWQSSTLSALVDNIIATHHNYLREALPRLSMLTQKVADAHGAHDPRLAELAKTFYSFRSELESHMMKEEQILFPLIKKIESGQVAAESANFIFGPISVMEQEHDTAGEALVAMRGLTDGFTPPQTACNTYRATMDALITLEKDLHWHIHKENNILFPRAIQQIQFEVS